MMDLPLSTASSLRGVSRPPLVVNSLLCFIHNFRESPRLKQMVSDCFAATEVAEATAILARRASPSVAAADVFGLYEALAASGRLPLFAATDLSAMPLTLIADGEKQEMLRELRALRRFISDALNGRIDESPGTRIYEPDDFIMAESSKLLLKTSPPSSTNSSASSGVLDHPGSQLAPKHETPAPGAAATSPNLPAPASAVQEGAPFDSTPSPVMDGQSPPKRRRNGTRGLDAAIAKLHRNHSEPREASPPAAAEAAESPSLAAPVVLTSPPAAAAWHSAMPVDYITLLRSVISSNCGGGTGAPSTVPFAAAAPAQSASALLASSSLSPTDTAATGEKAACFGSGGDVGQSMSGQLQRLTEDSDLLDDLDDSSPSPSDDAKEDADVDSDADKPFVCPHQNCAKRFANKFLLKKHQFIHTGLRPHTCPYCSKRFNRKDNLLRHKKTHLPGGATGAAEDAGAKRHAALSLFVAASRQVAAATGGAHTEDEDE